MTRTRETVQLACVIFICVAGYNMYFQPVKPLSAGWIFRVSLIVVGVLGLLATELWWKKPPDDSSKPRHPEDNES
jgi:hypothetical protein